MAQDDLCCRSAVGDHHREIAQPHLVYSSEILSPFAVLFGRVRSKVVEVPDKGEDRRNSKPSNLLVVANNLVYQQINQKQ